MVQKGNAFLEQEARKPRVDTEPMKAKLRDYQGRTKKLVKKVEKEPKQQPKTVKKVSKQTMEKIQQISWIFNISKLSFRKTLRTSPKSMKHYKNLNFTKNKSPKFSND